MFSSPTAKITFGEEAKPKMWPSTVFILIVYDGKFCFNFL
jgi:hypothetical protein